MRVEVGDAEFCSAPGNRLRIFSWAGGLSDWIRPNLISRPPARIIGLAVERCDQTSTQSFFRMAANSDRRPPPPDRAVAEKFVEFEISLLAYPWPRCQFCGNNRQVDPVGLARSLA